MAKGITLCLAAATLIGSFVLTVQGQTPQNSQTRTADKPEAAAEVNGRTISIKEIDDSLGAQLHRLEMQIYNLRKNALNNLITKALLEDEAKARGITVDALKQQLLPEKVTISTGEVDQVYLLNPSQFPNLSEDEAKQKISVDLESKRKFETYQAALAQIKSKAKVNIFLQPPSSPEVTLSDKGPTLGAKGAAVTIVEFSDFQCPYCKQAANIIKQIVQNNANDVRLIFKHLPLPMHAQAFKASQAAYCAGEQGKFWEYHDMLFERSDDLSEPALLRYASEIKLNPQEFNSCLASQASQAEILRNMQEARQSGVSATPTFFINGRMFRGIRSAEDFQSAIKQELDKKRKTAGSK